MDQSFPPVSMLPSVIDTTGWNWVRFEDSHDIWVGTDSRGDRWLLKLRGGFYAYREIVFARMAQMLGWSHQSSVFALLPADSAPRQASKSKSEEVQAVSWFLKEHNHDCGADCPLVPLFDELNGTGDRIEAVRKSTVPHILDLPRGEIASHVFGSNDGPQSLFMNDHRFVLIDSEQMFSSGPASLDSTGWWKRRDGTLSMAGIEFTIEVCRTIATLTDDDLDRCLSMPPDLNVDCRWDIREFVFEGRDFARDFVAPYQKP